jgi:hypothetical protein
LFAPGDWSAVETALGLQLPDDYKDLISDGIACVFGGELTILSPFDPNPYCNLFRVGSRTGWGLDYLRQNGHAEFEIALFPEPGGLLSWGLDNNGADYLWDTRRADPSGWTVVVTGRPVDPVVQRYPLGLVPYLDALKSGAIRAASYDDWPDPDAQIARRSDA